MNTYIIPVSDLPRQMEWAAVGPFLYGVDRAGVVYRLGGACPPKGTPRLRDRIREWWNS